MLNGVFCSPCSAVVPPIHAPERPPPWRASATRLGRHMLPNPFHPRSPESARRRRISSHGAVVRRRSVTGVSSQQLARAIAPGRFLGRSREQTASVSTLRSRRPCRDRRHEGQTAGRGHRVAGARLHHSKLRRGCRAKVAARRQPPTARTPRSAPPGATLVGALIPNA